MAVQPTESALRVLYLGRARARVADHVNPGVMQYIGTVAQCLGLHKYVELSPCVVLFGGRRRCLASDALPDVGQSEDPVGLSAVIMITQL